MTIVTVKRTAVHLSSDRNVFCTLERRSETRRGISPNYRPYTTHPRTCIPSVSHDLIFCNARITRTNSRRRSLVTNWSTFPAFSLLTLGGGKLPHSAKSCMLKAIAGTPNSAVIQKCTKKRGFEGRTLFFSKKKKNTGKVVQPSSA